jgi:aryl-phospho-beta-D-glucosidase BglC (GH1 family)
VKSGKTKVAGSNIGSWLVLEAWMAGNVWDDNGCDRNTKQGSYLLEQCLGSRAPAVMEKHWSSFITENDFAEMSKRGINVVRFPVGWWQIYDPQGGASKAKLNWHVTPTNYITGGLAYIDKAFEWGAKHGIGILLDMHAAPGSQNAFDNSSPAEYPPQKNWDKYDANRGQTVDSMELYAQRYGNHSALYGFCFLNEPNGMDIPKLQDYYNRAYAAVRKHSADSVIVINPLINGESGVEDHWINFGQGMTRLAMDLHYYSCFGGGPDQTNPDGAIGYINYDRKNQISTFASRNPGKKMLIGEWSSCNHFNNPSRNGDFAKAEFNVYDQASLGWTFWSWTAGSGELWSLKTNFERGWVPANLVFPC